MTPSRELLIADTSFVGHQRRAASTPQFAEVWPEDVVRRIDAAVLAISVVTIAEERFGHRVARWGERRRAYAESWLSQFMQLPVTRRVAEAWAWLKTAGLRRGRPFAANDLWIAATGYARGVPIVTCDKDFLGMRDLGVVVIYLPVGKEARVSAAQ